MQVPQHREYNSKAVFQSDWLLILWTSAFIFLDATIIIDLAAKNVSLGLCVERRITRN